MPSMKCLIHWKIFYLREKQFSSDVSHELRTPVSVILTESQYSLDYADTMEEAKDSFFRYSEAGKKECLN